MRRLDIIIVAVAGFIVIACATKTAPDLQPHDFCRATQQIRTSSSVGVIFPAECGPMTVFPMTHEVAGYWTPAPAVIEALEAHIRAALEHWRDVPADVSPHFDLPPRGDAFLSRELTGILRRLGQYHRQYLGVIAADGRRLVIVNCLPSSLTGAKRVHHSWEQQWVSVDDGGNSYWSVQYDAESRDFFGFDSNGYA